jgi:hypothetical protein
MNFHRQLILELQASARKAGWTESEIRRLPLYFSQALHNWKHGKPDLDVASEADAVEHDLTERA